MGASQSQPSRRRERHQRERDHEPTRFGGNSTGGALSSPSISAAAAGPSYSTHNASDGGTDRLPRASPSHATRSRHPHSRAYALPLPAETRLHRPQHSPTHTPGLALELDPEHDRDPLSRRPFPRPRSSLFSSPTRALAPALDPDDHHEQPSSSSSTPHRRSTLGSKISSLIRRNTTTGRNTPEDNTAKRERSASSSVHHASPGRPVQKRRRVAPNANGMPEDEELEELDFEASERRVAPNVLADRAPLATASALPMDFHPPSHGDNSVASSLSTPSAERTIRTYGAPHTADPMPSATSSLYPYDNSEYSPRSPGYSTPMSLPDFAGLASTSGTAAPSTPSDLQSASSPTDEQLADRLRTISTIRDPLGPDWTPTSSSASLAPVERLFSRFRRSSQRAIRERDLNASTSSDGYLRPPTPSLSSGGSTAATSATSASTETPPVPRSRSLSHRLSAIMGFASANRGDEWEESPSRSASTTTFGPGSAAAAPLVTTDDTSPSSADDPTRIPVGAVLVIQGLAQTHANLDETIDPAPSPLSSSASSSASRRGAPAEPASGATRTSRSASAGANPDPPRRRIDVASLDQQARMIGNLLTVAAAATATTLLSPTSLAPQQNRTTAHSAMQTILERFRPQRSRASQSIESTLGEYLRTVLRDNRRFAEAVAGDATSGNIPAEFQDFLHTLQQDLILAVRAYAVPEDELEHEGEGTLASGSGSSAAESFTSAEEHHDHDDDSNTVVQHQNQHMDEAVPLSRQPTPTPADTPEGAIPRFHHQRGQNLPGGEPNRLGVSGGVDGVPRRLNFFRAHLFPSVGNGGERAEDDDANAVVPSIFVGVRSVTHDPNMTTEDLVGHPGFPFLDGQVPDGPEDSESGALVDDELQREFPWTPPSNHSPLPPSTPSSSLSPPPANTASTAPASPRRTLRERVRDRFSQRRGEPRPHAPLNTYLIYVIGGNYPRSHPVLAIPSLVSGGPLTAEDLALVSELLGPAKPPTATAAEISRSGLTVVEGKDLAALVNSGSVLEASLERCMVCLSDYEPEEECRVLKCRHAFHRECVDHWLSQGRNSCPACRTEAVDKGAPATDQEGEQPAEPAVAASA